MKLIYLKFFGILALLAAFVLSPSCSEESGLDDGTQQGGGDEDDDSTQSEEDEVENPDYIYPDSVKISAVTGEYIDSESGVRSLDIFRGEQVDLSYSYAPEQIDVDEWSWSSSDSDIVNVDIYGKVTASLQGSAYVKVAYTGSSRVVADSILVNVEITPVTSIEVRSSLWNENGDVSVVEEGATLQLYAIVSPDNATYTDVVWSSDYPMIASVSTDGLVTGLVAGSGYEVTITATAIDDSGVVGEFPINVTQEGTSVSISIDNNFDFVYGLSQGSVQLTTTLSAGADPSAVVWSSSNDTVATIDESTGELTLLTYGNTTVTASYSGTTLISQVEVTVTAGLLRELYSANVSNYETGYAWGVHDSVASSTTWYDGTGENGGNVIGDATTGGYLSMLTTGTRADLEIGNGGSNGFGINEYYPYLAIHMDAPNSVSFMSFSFGGISITSTNPTYTYATSASNTSVCYVLDLTTSTHSSALAAISTGDINQETIINTGFLRVNTSSGTTLNLYSVQTFASLDDIEKYLSIYGVYAK